MSESTINLNNLLQNVAIIQKKYDENAKITGENFNIFSVMSMEYDEVYTHSAIIGELLNPNGSHGQGDIFLKIFVEEIRNSFKDNIQIDDFNNLINDKICERVISQSNDWENVTGGRIDIVIEDNKQILIIENKPGWEDQPYQLIRYNKYAETKVHKKAFLFYLTLNGRDLKKEEEIYNNTKGFNYRFDETIGCSTDQLNIHHCTYYPISFKIHIRDWIQKCIKVTNTKPLLQATLEQYLNLINKITFQTMSDEMKKDIVDSI